MANVTLANRTLYKDGAWNTICLPFNVNLNADGCPLAGATARPLTSASISGSTLNLTFGDAVTTLEAGTPYIIKWTADANYVDDDAHNIVSPVFSGVTIDKTDRSYDTANESVTTDERVRFLGTYKSTTFDAEDKSILLMGGANTLYYPTAGAGIGAQRAYFKIGTAPSWPAASPRSTSTSATTRPRELFRFTIQGSWLMALMPGSPSTAAASPPSPRAQAYILIMVKK